MAELDSEVMELELKEEWTIEDALKHAFQIKNCKKFISVDRLHELHIKRHEGSEDISIRILTIDGKNPPESFDAKDVNWLMIVSIEQKHIIEISEEQSLKLEEQLLKLLPSADNDMVN